MMVKIYMLCGLVASGKSTISKQLSNDNIIIHSSDEIRKELYSDESIQEDNQKVFQILHNRIKNDLKSGKDVCYDATNISYKRRMAFLQEIKNIDCEKICIIVATPYEKCLEQNKNRDRQVPEYVIERMYKNFYIPQYYEGWDKIEIIWNFDRNKFNTKDLLNWLCSINQDNPHHTLTIGNHCIKCAAMIKDGLKLFLAATYHDAGKAFTKAFIDSKGNECDIAHYYNHNLVSAYVALFYLKNYDFLSDNNILEICKLIGWHMAPFFINEKTEQKYINLLGEETWNDILKLHEADKSAK